MTAGMDPSTPAPPVTAEAVPVKRLALFRKEPEKTMRSGAAPQHPPTP